VFSNRHRSSLPNNGEIQNINQAHCEQLSRLELLALQITNRVGSPGFFVLIFAWTVLWIGWNLLAPVNLRFDPPSSFVFWLFISNMIQIFLMPLIMIGQNLQGRHSELRAESDFQINIKAEKEVQEVLSLLRENSVRILELTERLALIESKLK
jgi:uncharacterized membrane protein